jgi:hypothetical protein
LEWKRLVLTSPRSSYSSTITVLVGAEAESFTVHEDVICERSSFIKSAVTKGWAETQSKTVTVSECEAVAFKIYLESLYGHGDEVAEFTFSYIDDLVHVDERPHDDGDDTELTVHVLGLAKLWVLGDFLGDVRFQNEVMVGILEESNSGDEDVGITVFDYVRNNTAAESPLHKWADDYKLSTMTPETLEFEDGEGFEYPRSSVMSWLKYYASNRGRPDRPREMDLVTYITY